ASERSFAAARQQALGGGEADAGGALDSLPAMRVLGQLHDTYVVAETDGGLVLIDQHAADERVNYERLQQQFADGMATQALAAPVDLELTAREAELFASHADALAELGFEAEQTERTGAGQPGAGERTVSVTAVPAVFDAALDPELLRDVLGAFVSDGGAEAVEDVVDELLADLACYPSVTGNTSLTEGSVSDLLSALDSCENPYACPHGRPVVIELSDDEIAERFERDYPGHGGRRQR
ncbi:MAG: DNA mismatch repair protein MutL, partial [Halolamina sp.]